VVESLVMIRCFSRWMTVTFPQPYRCVSWAVINGGVAVTDTVAWLFLEIDEIEECGDIRQWFRDRLSKDGLEHAVGLLTSRRLHRYVESGAGTRCHAVATVGMSNALAAGDPPAGPPHSGTINILCVISVSLTPEAELEALALAAEARTAAVRDARIPSIVSGIDATGTGTDCVVIAHPGGLGAELYCGKHTELGHLIGKHVREAVHKGVEEWLREFRP